MSAENNVVSSQPAPALDSQNNGPPDNMTLELRTDVWEAHHDIGICVIASMKLVDLLRTILTKNLVANNCTMKSVKCLEGYPICKKSWTLNVLIKIAEITCQCMKCGKDALEQNIEQLVSKQQALCSDMIHSIGRKYSTVVGPIINDCDNFRLKCIVQNWWANKQIYQLNDKVSSQPYRIEFLKYVLRTNSALEVLISELVADLVNKLTFADLNAALENHSVQTGASVGDWCYWNEYIHKQVEVIHSIYDRVDLIRDVRNDISHVRQGKGFNDLQEKEEFLQCYGSIIKKIYLPCYFPSTHEQKEKEYLRPMFNYDEAIKVLGIYTRLMNRYGTLLEMENNGQLAEQNSKLKADLDSLEKDYMDLERKYCDTIYGNRDTFTELERVNEQLSESQAETQRLREKLTQCTCPSLSVISKDQRRRSCFF